MNSGIGGWWSHLTPATKKDLDKAVDKIMATVQELNTKLTAINAQLDKATAEIVDEINKLKAALNNVDLPADAQASLDALTTKVQALDDLNPDAPTPPPAP